MEKSQRFTEMTPKDQQDKKINYQKDGLRRKGKENPL